MKKQKESILEQIDRLMNLSKDDKNSLETKIQDLQNEIEHLKINHSQSIEWNSYHREVLNLTEKFEIFQKQFINSLSLYHPRHRSDPDSSKTAAENVFKQLCVKIGNTEKFL